MYNKEADIEYWVATPSMIKYCAKRGWDCYFIDHKCRVWHHGKIISNNFDKFINDKKKEKLVGEVEE